MGITWVNIGPTWGSLQFVRDENGDDREASRVLEKMKSWITGELTDVRKRLEGLSVVIRKLRKGLSEVKGSRERAGEVKKGLTGC